jgi:hypothetical protein
MILRFMNSPGGPFWRPEVDEALSAALQQNLRKAILALIL